MLRAINKWAVLRKLFEYEGDGADMINFEPEEVFKVYLAEAQELVDATSLEEYGIPAGADSKHIIQSAKEDAKNLLANKTELLLLIKQALAEIQDNIKRAVKFHTRHESN